MHEPVKILVVGANGQVGYELLRALAGSAIPLNPPSQAKGEGSDAAIGRKEEEFKTPFGTKGVAAQQRGDARERYEAIPLNPPSQAKGEGSDAPIGRKEEEFKTPFGTKGVAAQQRGDALARCKVIPATRDGWLENGAECERIDLADLAGLNAALDRITPDVIVNAAAYTAVDRAEDEPDLALRVNGDALGVIGAWAARHGARVVHYSTDYVFDGHATRAYREDDAPCPVSVYGRSKRAGEVTLQESGARHLIFRTAWVYAARGKNFLRTMLRLGAERDELRVVDDQIGAPTPARLIAKTTVTVLRQWLDDAGPARDGVYHLVAGGRTSWCGFARAIFDRADIPLDPPSPAKGEAGHAVSLPPTTGNAGHPVSHPPATGNASHPLPQEGGRAQRGGMPPHAPRIVAIRTADYPTRAARPAWSVLDTGKLRTTFGVALPAWETCLDEVIGDLAH